MITMHFSVRRRADVEPEEFHRYWRDEHGPLVRAHAAALGIRRYVQVHRIETPLNDALRHGRGALEPFDGTAMLWWDSMESLMEHGATPEGKAAGRTLLEDERRFVDLGASALWLGEEVPIIP